MTLEDFKRSITEGRRPAATSPALLALWVEAQGQWDEAHRIVQESEERSAAWVHAYLHRKEGDTSNAGYWYSRAGRKISDRSFEQEWEGIVTRLLEDA